MLSFKMSFFKVINPQCNPMIRNCSLLLFWLLGVGAHSEYLGRQCYPHCNSMIRVYLVIRFNLFSCFSFFSLIISLIIHCELPFLFICYAFVCIFLNSICFSLWLLFECVFLINKPYQIKSYQICNNFFFVFFLFARCWRPFWTFNRRTVVVVEERHVRLPSTRSVMICYPRYQKTSSPMR